MWTKFNSSFSKIFRRPPPQIVGYDNESATVIENEPVSESWNSHTKEVIEYGFYFENSKHQVSSIVNPGKVYLNKFHKEHTPHLTEEIISKAVSKKEASEIILKLLKKECNNGCDFLTYGEADHVWFHKMFEGEECNETRKELHQTFSFRGKNLMDPREERGLFDKPRLQFIDIYQYAVKYDSKIKRKKLVDMYKEQFGEEKLKTLKNHQAGDDAQMVYELGTERYGDKGIKYE